MSKITFRADDELVRRLEEFDASKSEVMREALRAYLDDAERETTEEPDGGVDAALAERVDELIAERLDVALDSRRLPAGGPQDVNVNITVDGVNGGGRGVNAVPAGEGDGRSARKTGGAEPAETAQTADEPAQTSERTCPQCGENVSSDHVYCPNCGEKGTHRVFCDCGDEVRSDWAFCPSCGRRTPAADVLDRR